MASITLAITEELKSGIEHFSWVTWSEAARGEVLSDMERSEALQKLDKMLEKSELTDEDCIRLGRELKERVWKRHKKEGW